MRDFDRVKQAANLKAYADDNLQPSRNGFYCCPNCGSGTHGTASSDGALSVKDDYWKCFSCGSSGDVFDLAGIVHNTESKREQLGHVAAWAGVSLSDDKPNITVYRNPNAERTPRERPTHLAGQGKGSAYIEAARAAFQGSDEALSYWQGRGFTEQEAQDWGVGFNPSGKIWTATDGTQGRERIVIPWEGSRYYHIDRAMTDKEIPNSGGKYDKPKSEEAGRQPLYNPEALKAPAFFIVEGPLDALAVRACGFPAVALGGTGSRQAVEEMQARGVSGVAVCMLDGDEAGDKAAGELCELLDAAGILHLEARIPNHNDAAEALEADRESLGAFLAQVHGEAIGKADALQEAEYKRIMQAFRVFNPVDVATDIFTLEGASEPIPTGLKQLDEVLGGGLVPGLYGLGAVSSLGKTTLAVQMADAIAASGRGVLFFTIEQSAKEIAAKSLSRYVAKLHPNYSGFTASEICSPSKRKSWGDSFNNVLLDACNAYALEVAPNLGIQEGKEQPSVSDVAAVARAWQKQHGQAPVVFIDYLQLMAAPSERDTDKQATDKNVMQLRQLARDMQTPIVAISSLNRSSYNEGVTLDAWKESGAIEYGADVLLGLQPEGTDEKLDDTAAAKQRREGMRLYRENKQATERTCEVKVLKNRHGRAEVKIPLVFKTLSSTFEEKEPSAQAAVRVL